MNQYFLEVRGKEKIDEWVDEGRRSRIVHLPGASKASLIPTPFGIHRDARWNSPCILVLLVH